MTLEDVLRAPLPDRVQEVAERIREIEKALPTRNGVRAFTSLYRAVTEDVDRRVRPETFADAPALTLDRTVGFAGRGLLRPLA